MYAIEDLKENKQYKIQTFDEQHNLIHCTQIGGDEGRYFFTKELLQDKNLKIVHK